MILATGGTMLGGSQSRLDLKDYRTGVYTVRQLVELVPEISDYADIAFEQLDNIDSAEISPEDWITLKNKVDYYLNTQDFDGLVIIHGTNTLEETAYFLHLTVNSEKPVVLVGSQRPLSAMSTDAEINLLNAVRVAGDSNAVGKGVMVVLNDEINSAREVTKTSIYRLDTFKSGDFGLLGYVDVDNTVQFYRVPTRKHTVNSVFSMLNLTGLPKVSIAYSYSGATGDIIETIVRSGVYKGIVIAGTGAGTFTRKERDALKSAVDRGMAVVRCSRVGRGRVVKLKQYGGFGFISGDNLNPQKARILLMLALITKGGKERIQSIFDEY